MKAEGRNEARLVICSSSASVLERHLRDCFNHALLLTRCSWPETYGMRHHSADFGGKRQGISAAPNGSFGQRRNEIKRLQRVARL
jgi:hypothetical protein